MHISNQEISHHDIYRVATQYEKVYLSSHVINKLVKTRTAIEKAVLNKQVIYGVTTGFGAFKNQVIPSEDVEELQERLVFSHAVGVGQPFPESVTRGIMFIIANYLSKGYSGVRPIIVKTLVDMLNKGVHPIIPEQGSVGSSGDLAPSAHLVLVLIGKGKANFHGKQMDGLEALKQARIQPVKLEAKEGLALLNNTATMTANAVIALAEAEKLADIADIAGALSAEALKATTKAYEKDIQRVRPHKGQILVASRLRKLLKGSSMVDNSKIQDQYSLRCIPQVHGAVRDALAYARNVVNIEINSVTDNPLIFIDDNGSTKVISGGNFHGEPIAIAMDTLGIAVSELANISDRRIASILDPATNHGLPPFLAQNGGLNSGMMILQYTTASLVSENKVFSHPASVDSIPTSANVEDLVSMGTIAARKARIIVTNVKHVLAIELLIACQAIDFRLKQELKLGKGTASVYQKIRKSVPFFSQDALYYPYISSLTKLIDEL